MSESASLTSMVLSILTGIVQRTNQVCFEAFKQIWILVLGIAKGSSRNLVSPETEHNHGDPLMKCLPALVISS